MASVNLILMEVADCLAKHWDELPDGAMVSELIKAMRLLASRHGGLRKRIREHDKESARWKEKLSGGR